MPQQKKNQQSKECKKIRRSPRDPGKTLINKDRRKARHASCLRPPKQSARSNPVAQTDSAGREYLVYPDGFRVYPFTDDGKSNLRAIFGGLSLKERAKGGKRRSEQDWNPNYTGNRLPA